MKSLHKTLLILVLLILIGLGGLIVVQNVWLTPKLTGNSITKTFTPQLLSELFIDGVFTINLLQDNTNEIKITTDEALFDCLTIKEHLHQFSLMHKSNCTSFGRNTPQITVDITFQQLKKLDFGGVSDVYSLNHAILEESLLLKVSGVSKANLHLTAPEIKADISGASMLNLSGQSSSLKMEVDGTSKLDLTTQSKDLLLEVSGASQVNAQGSSEYVNVEVNGVSKVDASNLVVEKAELEASGASSISVHAKEILSSMSDGISSIRNIQ